MIKRRYFPLLWNKPGGDPWRRKPPESGPPDLDEVLQRFFRKGKQLLLGGDDGQNSQSFMGMLVGVVLIVYLASGIYIVNPPERAAILRFGQYVRTEGPGPHWLLPIVESKRIVNVQRVSTSDHNGLMLTEDGNIVSVGVAVQYKIGSELRDLEHYLFNVLNPVRSLNRSAESALRQVIGKSTMDDILTLRRDEIASSVKEQMIDTLRDYKTGISVLEVAMQFAKAPTEVQEAFDEVIKASADKERLINQARGYENEVLPRAKGVAERLRNEARAYKDEKVLIAKGNAERFNLVLPEYEKAPKVTQTRMYLNTMEEVLRKVSKVVVDSQGNNLIYLPLEQLIANEKTKEIKTKEHLPIASQMNKEKK